MWRKQNCHCNYTNNHQAAFWLENTKAPVFFRVKELVACDTCYVLHDCTRDVILLICSLITVLNIPENIRYNQCNHSKNQEIKISNLSIIVLHYMYMYAVCVGRG